MTPTTPVRRELLLAGGGHAHLGVLRDLVRHGVPPGLRVTLLAREAAAIYSGMLPGLIAGRFTVDDCLVDLPRLVRAAGARFIRAEACGLDRDAQHLLLAGDRPPMRYDLLSLNLGAEPVLVPGAAEHALPLRPFGRFLPRWEALLAQVAKASRPLRLLVVGAGAAGVEVALALHRRLGPRAAIGLLATGGEVLPSNSPAARRLAHRALIRAGIALHGGEAARVEPGTVLCAEGGRLEFDAALWATGAAPAPWFRDAGLALCPRGFLAVDATLRSIGDARVFAAGDCATVLEHPRERAGVFAVRQGPPLAANLRRVLAGEPPRPFRPQRRYLALVTSGADRAMAFHGSLAAEGGWALRLKDRIDRRWIAMHAAMRPMARRPAPVDPAPMRCGGCGAKLPPAVLARVLARLPRGGAVPLGLAAPDDAALLRPPGAGQLMVQTVDMFRAFVDDPWLFGRIAANHALGDLAAMGATPRAALAIAALPPAAEAVLEADLLAMLRGAQDVLAAAGAELVGGHSAEGLEPMLGFALTGEVTEGRALRRADLRPGDVLVLTKGLGTGALLAAAMQGGGRAAWTEAAYEAMQRTPFPAARILGAHGATACTDVTGFGLLNHLAEMLEASGVAAALDPHAVPALAGAAEVLAAGARSTLHPANAAAAGPRLGGGWAAVPPAQLGLLLDPQTAGGLLAGVPAAAAADCLAALRRCGNPDAAAIGVVRPGLPGISPEPGAGG
ncbi:selenide, water dikinase SelD [Siccirubricoccus deserti]|uniref:Selenide, water dikinase SelD n=1 Tax=Siccirubricoccus deserti TaxID=2013562 RepID=A0A9X0UF42_9PROT|nr:selenide, water dikinase SelD [Siccirubricoccus deserti]MBC4018357.1 selenide, water dikinase SelD [Siccirubricoccus deserti]